jgi:hypothetical protein
LRGLGIGVTPGGVTKFGQHPGAEDRAHPGLRQDDLSVRVPAKMLLHLPLQDVDLFVEHAKHRDDRSSGSRVRVGDDLVSAKLFAARTDWMRVALVSMSRRRACLSAARIWLRFSLAAETGSGALPSSSSVSGASRSSNASSAAGKYSRSAYRSRRVCRLRSQISV